MLARVYEKFPIVDVAFVLYIRSMSMQNEIWKDIPGYEGLYQVSNWGRVKSLNYHQTGRIQIMKPNKLKKGGYLRIRLCKNGDSKRFLVHTLVALAFVPNPDPEHKTQCNHINEITSDNRAVNLNWMTPKENTNWGTHNERVAKANINGKCSKCVKQKTKDGELIRIWPSASEIERILGISQGHISWCCLGKRKSAGGYLWEYV